MKTDAPKEARKAIHIAKHLASEAGMRIAKASGGSLVGNLKKAKSHDHETRHGKRIHKPIDRAVEISSNAAAKVTLKRT